MRRSIVVWYSLLPAKPGLAVSFTDCVKTKFYTENIRVGIGEIFEIRNSQSLKY